MVYNAVPEIADWKRRHPEIFKLAEDLEGIMEKRGIHASGVLITEDPLVEVCPQQFSGKAKEFATSYDMNDVEKVGGVKFDFLSTKVLTVISRSIAMIDRRYNKKIDIDNLIPSDKAALDVFARGDTTGIFQFESDGMRKMLRGMKGVTFEDVIAANALFRPGPMKNIPSYCRRKVGEEAVNCYVAALEPILKQTLGVIVYQEQVMRAVRVLAGFTASEADTVRKAIGKKKKDLLEEQKGKFVKGCDQYKLCTQSMAENLWDLFKEFGAYAFNKSHSAGYSFTAYQCAYLKAHFPEEFMACQLTVEAGDGEYDTVKEYEHAADYELGIKVLKPDINHSKGDYQVVDKGSKKAILRGFKGIMGVGQSYLDIERGQPFADMRDYCMRAGAGAGAAVSTTLIDLGAFDFMLEKLSVKLGRKATNGDLLSEYNNKKNEADGEKKLKGALKAEKKGIKPAFGFEEEEEEKTAVPQFSL